MFFNSKEFKQYEKGHQYTLHSRDTYFIERNGYDVLPLRIIHHDLRLAVDEVLCKYQVEVLSDIPYGQGYLEMRKRFAVLLKESKEMMESKKINI